MQPLAPADKNGMGTHLSVPGTHLVGPAKVDVAADLSGLRRSAGLTLIELIVVLVCLAVTAVLVVPMFGSSDASELKAAAELLVADLEYAQAQSLGHDDPRGMTFDTAANTYTISPKSAPSTPIINPIGGQPYVTRFGSDRAAPLGRVRIASFSLGGDNRVGFGAHGQLDQSPAASITLACGGLTLTLTMDPVTGEVAVGEIQ